jgi:hypothetical protein
MSLRPIGTIAIPKAEGNEFDHAAFNVKNGRFSSRAPRDYHRTLLVPSGIINGKFQVRLA